MAIAVVINFEAVDIEVEDSEPWTVLEGEGLQMFSNPGEKKRAVGKMGEAVVRSDNCN